MKHWCLKKQNKWSLQGILFRKWLPPH